MANYLKFPSSYAQHVTAFQYASNPSNEESGYEPDYDNGTVGSTRYASFFSNPSKMPKSMSSKYTNYIQLANKAGKILKF